MNVKNYSMLIILVLFRFADCSESMLHEAQGLTLTTTESSINLQFDLSGFAEEFSPNDYSNTKVLNLGQGTLLVPGKPVLPAISKFVIVPPSAGLELQVITGDSRRIQAENSPLLYEEENVLPLIWGNEDEIGNLFPPVLAKMSDPVIIRGTRVVKVTTYPVQYDSHSNSYILHDQISAEIHYTDADPVQPVRNPNRRHQSREFLKYIRALTVNGDQVFRDDLDDILPYVGHYLIVSHENCLEYAAPFIEWRRKAGYKVEILSYDGNQAQNPNQIKDEIQDLYDSYIDDGEDPFDQILLIGDRVSYYNDGNGQWILGAFPGNQIWGNIPHSDYEFACLEGNDDFPDAGFARLPSGSRPLMELAVGRILAYEAEPFMDEPEWFTKGAVYSQHWGLSVSSAWHVSINTNVRWGNQVLRQLGFDDIEFFEDFDWDQNANNIGPWFRDIYNEGRNVLIGRAQLWNWTYNFDGVNNNVVFPINIATNGMGDWSGAQMFRTGDGDNLKGPVALTFGHGDSPTIPMSCVWMEMTNGILLKDLTLGWGRVLGVTALEAYIEDFNYQGQSVYGHVKTDIEAFGDPGIQPWIGVPRTVAVEIPENINPFTRVMSVHVFDPDDDEAVAGAQVTCYSPGDMPDFDDDVYAEYDGMIMATTTTNEEGIARVVFDEGVEFVDGTPMYITVTGRDILPHFDDIEISVPDMAVELVGYDLVETAGNGDGNLNPGELFTIEIIARNPGDEAVAQDITAVVSSSSPWIEIEENEVDFGDIEPGDEALGNPEVEFTLSAACQDGASYPIAKPTLNIEFVSGNQSWISAIKLDPLSPKLTVHNAGQGFVIPVGRSNMDVIIENSGRLDSPEMGARLVSLSPILTVVQDESVYPAVEMNDRAGVDGDEFIVTSTVQTIPGSFADLMLIFSSEAGFIDTACFTVQIGNSDENFPHPPDEYGFTCFDDTDEEWVVAPEYEWIEINPDVENPDLEGELLDFEGESILNIGEARVVDLGFEAQFYGYNYDQITVSSNGFIVFGDDELMVNPQNWPMDRCIGGMGMAAPFWDWLSFANNSAIYAIYDEENAQFIVEWYRMRHITGDNVDQTFQVIIKDPNVWINETGDSDLIFQYNSISNIEGPEEGRAERERNNYYASVGISSPEGTTGINYTFNNIYPISSAEIEAGRAILFTTQTRMIRARIYGQVIDVETREPIPNATILTMHGFVAFTDEEGRWELNDVLAEIAFSIVVSAPGYNATEVEIEPIQEEDELEIIIELTHPEFSPSVDAFVEIMEIGEEVEINFELTNTGNGPLDWSVTRELSLEANFEPWELRRNFAAGAAVDDSRIRGVVFANERYYVSGDGNGDPQIYVFNGDFELVDSFDQPAGEGRYGIRDMAFDGELIWGAFGGTVFGFDLNGDVFHEWQSEYDPTTAVAWDSDREVLWLAATTSDPIAYTTDGNRVEEFGLERSEMRIYGMAYWEEDPDDCNLYVFHKDRDLGCETIQKYNPENGESMFVGYLLSEDEGTPLGACITNQLDNYSWVFIAVSNVSGHDGGDRIDTWQLAVNKGWMQIEPTQGILQPNDVEEFVLTLNTADLEPEVYEGDLVFRHNSIEGESRLGITLEISEGVDFREAFELNLHRGFSLISLNVDPDDPDIFEVMAPLVDRGVLDLIKDGEGRFCAPNLGFNNIPRWRVENGYIIDMAEAAQLRVQGTNVPPCASIQLHQGWNMKAYFPDQALEVQQALSGIEDVLFIAKNGVGQFYLPEFDFCNMTPMRPGNGYQYNVVDDVELVYNTGDQAAILTSIEQAPVYYQKSIPTGINSSVLILGKPQYAGWEIAAVASDGSIVGSGKFNNEGKCGLSVWGSNPLDSSLPGLVVGEPFTLRLWKGTSEVLVELLVNNSETLSTYTFEADGVLVGELIHAELPSEFTISDIYPNPFNAQTRINYTLPDAGNVRLVIYNLAGQMVSRLVNGYHEAGYHTEVWSARDVPSGIYFVKLTGGGKVVTRKVMLMK